MRSAHKILLRVPNSSKIITFSFVADVLAITHGYRGRTRHVKKVLDSKSCLFGCAEPSRLLSLNQSTKQDL
jgi:hypothetical protein